MLDVNWMLLAVIYVPKTGQLIYINNMFLNFRC